MFSITHRLHATYSVDAPRRARRARSRDGWVGGVTIRPTVARRSVAVAVANSSDRKASRETSEDRRGDVSTSSASASHRSHPRGLGVEETTESAVRSSERASTEEQTSAKGMKTVERRSGPRVEGNTAVAEESSYDDDDDGEGSRDETRKSPSASSTASWNRKRGDEARKTEEMEETKTSEGKKDVTRGEISHERVIDDDDGDEKEGGDDGGGASDDDDENDGGDADGDDNDEDEDEDEDDEGGDEDGEDNGGDVDIGGDVDRGNAATQFQNCTGNDCNRLAGADFYRIVEDVAEKAALPLNDAPQPVLDILSLTSGAAQTMQEEATDQRVAALTMTVMIGIVLLTVMLGVILKHYKSRWFHPSGAGLLLGIAVGCFVFIGLELSYETMPENMRYSIKAFAQCMRFDTKFFFLVLLPPLIFEAGYTLHPTVFFQNADAISVFAFLGSLTSAISTGVLVYLCGVLGVSYGFSLKSAMLFGALISSTDPVTTLSIFSEPDMIAPDLHAIILGESILNDAVTIVYFESLLLGIGYSGDVTALELLQTDDAFVPLILQAIGTFLLAFGQATFIGFGMGCISALLHKYVNTTKSFEEGWAVDSTLVLLFPYLSYSLAETFELSGIVAVLFTGIVMGRYTRPNLSRAPRMITMCIFKIFSFLSETFVFVYMGSAMYSFRWSHILTAFVGLIATYLGRAVNIFPGSILLNMSKARRNSHLAITANTQYLLWFCGLRGAVAFALAVKAQRDLGEQGHVMFDVTLFIVAFTIVIQGGMTRWFLDKYLEKPTSSDERSTSRKMERNFFAFMGDIATKVIEPVLLAKSAISETDEQTSLLHRGHAVSREEAAESPRSSTSHGALASETVEAAVDNTFEQMR